MNPVPEEKTPSMLLKELSDKRGTPLRFDFKEFPRCHPPKFVCSAYLNKELLGEACGPSKKAAKQSACLRAIEFLAENSSDKELLRQIYHGKNEIEPNNPVSAVHEWCQKRRREIRFESRLVCRAIIAGELAATAEGENPAEVKRKCCEKVLIRLNAAAKIGSPVSSAESSPSDLYLQVKNRELTLTSEESTEVEAAISAVFSLKGELVPCGISDILVIGSAAMGAVRRSKLIVDVALVSNCEIDMGKCAAAIAPAVLSGKTLTFARIDSEISPNSAVFTLKFRRVLLKFISIPTDSPILAHVNWLSTVIFSESRLGALRLIRHWISQKPERRCIPSILSDFLVVSHTATSDSLGVCFRKVMEFLSSGGILDISRMDMQQCHKRVYDAWELRDRETAAAEAFVTVVVMARGEVSAVV